MFVVECMGKLDNMFFSKNVQVKSNLLENFGLKICERKTKAGLCKKNFNFLDQLF